MASDAAGVRSPFLGCGVRLASPATRVASCRGGREAAGAGAGRDALRCTPLRVGPPSRRTLRPCAGADDGDKPSGAGGGSSSYGKAQKEGGANPFKKGAKEWCGDWWPQAVDASTETDRAVAESAENLGEWAYNLMEGVGNGVDTTTTEVIDAIGDAGRQLEIILRTRDAKSTKRAAEAKKSSPSFVDQVPILKSYFGRKDGAKGAPKPVKKVPVKRPIKKPVAPVKKVPSPTRAQAKSSGYGGALQGLANMGQKPKTDEVTNGAKPTENGEKNNEQIPLLKTFFGEYGRPDSKEATESAPAAPAPKEAPKKVYTPPPKPKPVEAKKEPVVAKPVTYSAPVTKPAATIPKKETPAPKPPAPSTPEPKPAAPQPVAATKGYGASAPATPPAKKAPTGQGYEKLVKESVGTPAGMGKGLEKAKKSSGGAVGGPYNVGLKEASKKAPAKKPLASTGGGGGSRGTYGGGGGSGGSGGGDGSKDDAGDGGAGRFKLILALLLFAVVVGGVWYKKRQEEKEAECAATAKKGKK